MTSDNDAAPDQQAPTLAQRLAHMVAGPNTEDCVEWAGYRDADGYGVLVVEGRHWRAHRLAWALANENEPDGLVLHSCDNPPCVNPAHLRVGTARDNAIDRTQRHRAQTLRARRWARAGQQTLPFPPSPR